MSTLDDNLAKRMKVTMGSELEPEMATPNTAGFEEVPEGDEIFPLVKQFRQTNMGKSGYSRNTSRRGRGKDD